MAKVITSFAELAKVMGKSKPEEMKVSQSAFDQVEAKCGRKAAIIFAYLNEQESCKRYGKAGQIIHTPQEIAEALGMDEGAAIGYLVALIRNGFAKITPDQKVKAA
jgi:hypothetical protein